jgi:hypothetical protein
MSCELITITEDSCVDPYGGIHTTYLIPCEEVDTFTFGADNEITGLSLVVTPAPTYGAVKFVYEDDDTGYYNQTGERTNKRHTFEGEAFMKFVGLDITKVKAANGLKACCCLYAFHFTNSGIALAQGVEWNPDIGASGDWRRSIRKCRATVNVMTGTGEEEDRVEITLTNKSRYASPVVDMTMDEFDALTV